MCKNIRLLRIMMASCFLLSVLVAVSCTGVRPSTPPPDRKPDPIPDPQQAVLEVIREQPGTSAAAEAHYRLGLMALDASSPADATRHFTEAAGIADSHPWNRAAQIELLSLADSTSSESLIEMQAAFTYLFESGDVTSALIERLAELTAVALYEAEDWDTLRKFIDQLGTDIRNRDRFVMMKGIAMSHQGNDQAASVLLKGLLDTSSDDIADGVLEFIDIELRLNRPESAVDTLLAQTTQSEDPRLLRKLAETLPLLSDLNDLHDLAKSHRDDSVAPIIRIELINRLIDEGSISEATDLSNQMHLRYPEYSKALDIIDMQLVKIQETRSGSIGLLVPLSGHLASIGHSIFRGAQLALTDYEQAGGSIPFSLSVSDSGDTIESVETGYRELADIQHVIAIIGPVRSHLTEVLLPLSNADRMVIITPGTPKDDIVSKSKWVFRLYPSVSREIEALVRFSIRDLGIYRFGCLYPDIEFGLDAFKTLESAVVSERAVLTFGRKYQKDLGTIRSSLAALTDNAADVVIIPDSAERAAIVAGQLRFQEILTPTIAGIGAWETNDLIEIAGNNLDGSYFAASYPQLNGPRRAVAERYATKFGEMPDSFALRSYEAMQLLITAIHSGVRDRPHLRRWLTAPEGLTGLDGTTRFSPEGEYLTPVTIYRIWGPGYEPWRIIPVELGPSDESLPIDRSVDPVDPVHQPGPQDIP